MFLRINLRLQTEMISETTEMGRSLHNIHSLLLGQTSPLTVTLSFQGKCSATQSGVCTFK